MRNRQCYVNAVEIHFDGAYADIIRSIWIVLYFEIFK